MNRLSVALAAVLIAPVAVAETGEEWSITIEVSMPGMPAGVVVPPQTTKACSPKRTDAPPFTGVRPGDDCQVVDAKQTGQTWTWKLACKNGMKGSGTMTLKGEDSFAGTSEMEVDGQLMSSKITGKRLGACDYQGPPAAPAPAKKKAGKS